MIKLIDILKNAGWKAYVIDYDKETMEQNIDTSTFDCINEAKIIAEEILKLTGNL